MAFLLCEAMKKVAATIDQLIVKLYRYSSSFVVGTLACMHSCIPRPNRILNHLQIEILPPAISRYTYI